MIVTAMSSLFNPEEVMLTSLAPLNSAGGVFIVGGNGKIDIDNTFETRLKHLKESALPAIRETLFGKNPNRKFFD
jgi:Archaeal/vacuolar-type H+-ATPase subunit E